MKGFVLFVDDEDKILVSLERELEEWLAEKDLSFRSAGGVDAALDILVREHEDCHAVVSDLKMPHKKGSELLLEIGKKWSDIGTILLTGFSDMDEIKDCIKAGILSFMQKPWNRDMLKAELERVVSLTALKREHRAFYTRLERDFTWTRKLHHELLLNARLPGNRFKTDIGFRFARGTLDCGGDIVLSFEGASGALFLCFGSLSVTGVEGTYHGARIRDLLLGLKGSLSSGDGPDVLLGLLNDALVNEYAYLPENSLSMSVFRFSSPEVFSCAHAGGEHFALVAPNTLQVNTLPSPVLGLTSGILFPVKKYTFPCDAALVLFSRNLHHHVSTKTRFLAAMNTLSKADAFTSPKRAQEYLDEIIGSDEVDFDSTLFILNKIVSST